MLAVVHCRLHRIDQNDHDDGGYDWLTYMKLTDRIGDLRKRLERMKRGCETSTYVVFENSYYTHFSSTNLIFILYIANLSISRLTNSHHTYVTE